MTRREGALTEEEDRKGGKTRFSSGGISSFLSKDLACQVSFNWLESGLVRAVSKRVSEKGKAEEWKMA